MDIEIDRYRYRYTFIYNVQRRKAFTGIPRIGFKNGKGSSFKVSFR